MAVLVAVLLVVVLMSTAESRRVGGVGNGREGVGALP